MTKPVLHLEEQARNRATCYEKVMQAYGVSGLTKWSAA